MKKTIQISPHGIFEKVEEDKSRVVQICDAAAFAAVVADWERRGRPKILLDYLHKRGEAAGWIVALRADPAEGLLGDVEYTPPGAQAVAEKLYRFPSADWLVSADGRPFQLRTVGLTNTPNIPVRPVSNSAPEAGSTQTPTQKEKPKMEAIKKKLGLPPEADEAAVEAAIQALLDQAAAAQAAATNAKAQTVAVANAARIQNSEAFIAAYCQAPEAAEAVLASLKPAAAPAADAPRRIVNSAGAQAPAQAAAAAARKFASRDEAKAALAKVPVGQRKAFFAEHASDFEA